MSIELEDNMFEDNKTNSNKFQNNKILDWFKKNKLYVLLISLILALMYSCYLNVTAPSNSTVKITKGEDDMSNSIILWNWFRNNEDDYYRNHRRDSLSHWNSPFSNIYSEIDKVFNDAFSDMSMFSNSTRGNNLMNPKINVSESKDEYTVHAELPGIKEEDVEVTIDKGILSIKAERKKEETKDDKHYHRMESSYGMFQRSMRLPENVREDEIEAKFNSGVLEISIKKDVSKSSSPRKLEIKK